MGSTKRALRKRCPICRKLRGFREPNGRAGGTDHPNRKPWARVNGVLICGWCAGTPFHQEGPGTEPHGWPPAKAAEWEVTSSPGGESKMARLQVGSAKLTLTVFDVAAGEGGERAVHGSCVVYGDRPLQAVDLEAGQRELELVAEHALAQALRELRAYMRPKRRRRRGNA